MNVFILYRPNSEHDTRVTDYVRDFMRSTGHELEIVSLDTVDGAQKAKLYDVMRYPAIVAAREDGSLVQLWQDEFFPTMNEVSAYLNQ